MINVDMFDKSDPYCIVKWCGNQIGMAGDHHHALPSACEVQTTCNANRVRMVDQLPLNGLATVLPDLDLHAVFAATDTNNCHVSDVTTPLCGGTQIPGNFDTSLTQFWDYWGDGCGSTHTHCPPSPLSVPTT